MQQDSKKTSKLCRINTSAQDILSLAIDILPHTP